MEPSNFAVAVVGLSMLSGFMIAVQPEIPALEKPGETQDSNESRAAGNSSLQYGSAHEHALFHVVVNGTELGFTADRYQLNSEYVHLESNRSSIVHKHAKGVSWSYFLDTLNVSVDRSGDRVCFKRPGERYCGKGRIALEGGKNLSAEITQGDNLVIVIGGDINATVEEYHGKQLPQLYKPQESRGYRA